MPLPLVGRDAEMELAQRLVVELPHASAVLLVTGEAGIGKTSLVDGVAALAAERAVRVLRGGCAPLSGDVPFAPLQGVLPRPDDAGRPTELVLGAAGRALSFARFDAALAAVGPDPGTMLLVEDVHWADMSTLGYLGHLTRNLPAAGLLLVLTYRLHDAEETRDGWLAEQARCPTVRLVQLRPLTAAETVEQVRTLAPEVPDRVALAIHGRSGGNPYLTSELVGADADGELPVSLGHVLLARLRAVGERPCRVVAAAGALSRPLTDRELVAAVGGDERAVRTAYDRNLVVRAHTDPPGWQPRHPVLAEVAYRGLLVEQRRILHALLAEVLEESLPSATTAAQAAEVAEQHLLAGHADDTLAWSVRAADAAAGQHAYAEAGRWYAQAVAVWPAATTASAFVPARSVLADAGGRCLSIAGRHESVVEVLNGVLDEEPASWDMAPLLLRRGWSRFVLGDTNGALADLDESLALLAPDDADLAALVQAHQAHVLGTCSRWPEALAAAESARSLASVRGNRRVQGLADTVLGAGEIISGKADAGLLRIEAARATATELGEPDDLALAGVCIVDQHVMDGSLEQAVSSAEAIRSDLRRLTPEGHWLDDMLGSNQACALVSLGEWDRAVATARDVAGSLGFTELTVAAVDVARGDAEAARERLRRSAGLDRVDQPQFHLGAATQRAALALLEDRPADALETAQATARLVSGTELEIWAQPLLLAGARAAATLRRPDELDSLAELLPGAFDGVAGAATCAEVAAWRADAADDPDATCWLQAVACWRQAGRPYETARAQVRAAAALLRQRGRRREAAAALAEAWQTAVRLRAAPLRAEAEDLGRVARLPLPPAPAVAAAAPADVGSPLGLTAREVEVLALVAEGKSNREIGQQLYMSPKTASVHVTHILQKLGVRTRVQAAAVAVRHGLPRE
jgi:DNA-binding NarL/FixJ family response regulator